MSMTDDSSTIRPFKRFHAFVDKSSDSVFAYAVSLRFIHLTSSAIEPLVAPNSEILAKEFAFTPDEMAILHKLVAVAGEQEGQGYTIVFAHALADCWEALQRLVEDLLIAWLLNYPAAPKLPDVTKVKLPLADFMSLDDEGRMRLLINELQSAKRAKFNMGIGQFDELLKVFDLKFGVDEQLRKELLAMQQLRNVIVHRDMVVDRRLAEQCTWLGLRPGDRLSVPIYEYHRYLKAARKYAYDLELHVFSKINELYRDARISKNDSDNLRDVFDRAATQANQGHAQSQN